MRRTPTSKWTSPTFTARILLKRGPASVATLQAAASSGERASAMSWPCGQAHPQPKPECHQTAREAARRGAGPLVATAGPVHFFDRASPACRGGSPHMRSLGLTLFLPCEYHAYVSVTRLEGRPQECAVDHTVRARRGCLGWSTLTSPKAGFGPDVSHCLGTSPFPIIGTSGCLGGHKEATCRWTVAARQLLLTSEQESCKPCLVAWTSGPDDRSWVYRCRRTGRRPVDDLRELNGGTP